MIIGFSGTQRGMTKFQKEQVSYLLKLKECEEFQHGDCVGADYEAANIAVEIGVKLFTVHPPIHDVKQGYWMDRAYILKTGKQKNYDEWYELIHPSGAEIKVRWRKPKQFLERNKDIVNEAALFLAAPKEYRHTLRSGTWATIRHCWKLRKDIIIIPPVERSETYGEDSE